MKSELGVMIINSVTNILLTFMKIVVGFLFNSQLLIADGIHSASDLLTDVFAIVGLKLSSRPKDDDHPFGHSKLEYLASITVSMLIFFVTYNLIIELISNWNVVSNTIEKIVLFVAGITFIIKFILSSYVLKKGQEFSSLTLRNSGLESRTDAISTIIVVIGLLLTVIGIKYNIDILLYSEKIATVFVIVMLIKVAGEIYYNSMIGMAGTFADEKIKEKYIKMIANENVKIDEIIVIKEGTQNAISITLVFNKTCSIEKVYSIKERVKSILLNENDVNKVSVDFTVN